MERQRRLARGITTLLMIGIGLLLLIRTASAQSAFGLQNRWKTGEYINLQYGDPRSTAIDTRWLSAQWIAEPISGSTAIRLKNRAQPNIYLHVQNQRLEAGPAPLSWWSSHWNVEQLGDPGVARLQNRWLTQMYIHNQNGKLEAGAAPVNWWSSHWVVRPVVHNAQANADVISVDAVADVSKGAIGTAVGINDFRNDYNDYRNEQRTNTQAPQNNRPNSPNRQPNVPDAGDSFGKTRAKNFGKAAVLKGPPTNVPFSQGLQVAEYGGDICWKDSYGRGVGTIPTVCPPDRPDNDAGLCYPRCRPGYTDFVTMCVPDCPPGFRNDGLYCFKPAPVTRSAFPWKFGDRLGSLNDARARCRKSADGRKYGCSTENGNTIVYSKCPSGFKVAPVITSLCTPQCPSNTTDIGISCQKNTYDRGVGRIPECGGSAPQKDAGLCYPYCQAGYTGIGPVCWSQKCPAQYPVNCGASCAVSKNACIQSVASQVTAPLDVVTNIAGLVLTGGAANAAKSAAMTGAKAGAKAAAKAASRAAIKESLRRQAKAMGKELAESTLDNAAETMYEASQSGEFDFASLDPTGIASVVTAYWKPLCADIK